MEVVWLLYEKAIKEHERLEKEIQHLELKMEGLPEENLILAKNGTSFKWYCTDGKHKVYIPSSEHKKLEKIAYKKYYSLRLKNLLREKKAIEFYLKHHDENAYQQEQELLENKEFQKLISRYFLPKEQRLVEWMKEPYLKNEFKSEMLVHRTSAGIRVRSKSEAFIVTTLCKYQIPFRYECALEIGGKIIYPDFTIIHPVTGEVFYWEHFGRMDEDDYKQDAIIKINNYLANGIIPNINLITTFETKTSPLCEDLVETLVRYYFL